MWAALLWYAITLVIACLSIIFSSQHVARAFPRTTEDAYYLRPLWNTLGEVSLHDVEEDGRIRLNVFDRSRAPSLRIDVDKADLSYDCLDLRKTGDEAPERGGPLTGERVLSWLAGPAVTPEDTRESATADELAGIIHHISEGAPMAEAVSNLSHWGALAIQSGGGYDRITLVLLTLLWACVWLAGYYRLRHYPHSTEGDICRGG